MKKIIKIFVTIIIIALIIIIGKVLLQNGTRELEIQRIQSQSKALQTTSKSIEDKENYYIEIEKLDSGTFMDQRVNEYVESIILNFSEENNTDQKIKSYERAVLTNDIDSFKVNENIYGIRVTSNIKRIKSDEYSTLIKTFNYKIDEGTEITLDDLFKNEYEATITQESKEQYVLTEKNIIFYEGQLTNEVSYNSLKEYAKFNVLNANNLEISQDEYDKLFANIVDPTRKMVAITFDDGPHSTNTYNILEALEKYNGRATFFMLGQCANANPEVVKKVYEQGNEIGIHTWSHPQLTKLSSEKIIEEVQSTSDVIYNLTGYRPKIVRPPYGAINDTVKSTLSNYPLIMWNIDSLDWKSRDENKIVPLVMGQVQDGDIILLHDIHSTTVPAAEKIIAQLTEQGFQLVTVSELIEAKGYDTSKTQVFYSGRQ